MNLVHSVAKAISVPFQASSAVNVTIPIAASWNQLMSKSASAAFSSSVPGDSNRESSHPSARKLAKLEPVSAEDDSKAGHGNAPWQVTGMGLGSDPACSDADVFALEEKVSYNEHLGLSTSMWECMLTPLMKYSAYSKPPDNDNTMNWGIFLVCYIFPSRSLDF